MYLFRRKQHGAGYLLGIIISSIFIIFMQLPLSAGYYSPGPMTAGHENAKCEWCHKQVNGTLRQKFQANIQYLIDLRKSSVPLGYRQVVNDDCIACHKRSDDRHPVFRFFEPRYEKARKEIRPHYCVSCHKEHSGERVSITPTFCVTCHKNLKLKNDPVSIPHEELIKNKQWHSCLGCHDFHGNHKVQVTKNVKKVVSRKKIELYLMGGPNIYSNEKKEKARETPDDET